MLRAAAAPFQPVHPPQEAADPGQHAAEEAVATSTRSACDVAVVASSASRNPAAAATAGRPPPCAADKRFFATDRNQPPPLPPPPPLSSSSTAPSSLAARRAAGTATSAAATKAPAAQRGAQQSKAAFGQANRRRSGSVGDAARPMTAPSGKPRSVQRGLHVGASADKPPCDGATEEGSDALAEAEAEAEAAQASDLVWREVESWVEAEAQAEDAAWEVLAFSGKASASATASAGLAPAAHVDGDVFDPDGSDDDDDDDDDEDEEEDDDAQTAESWPAGIAGSGRGRPDAGLDTLKTQDPAPSLALSRPPLGAGAASPMPPTPLAAFSPLAAPAAHGSSMYPFPSPQAGPGSPLDHAFLALRRSPQSLSSSSLAAAAAAAAAAATTATGASLKQTHRCVSPSNSSIVTSNTGTSGGRAAGAATTTSPAYAFGLNRSLHHKLSSPDRKRAVSPSEVKTKSEQRQLSAEAKRGRNLAARRMKATLVLDRVKVRGVWYAVTRIRTISPPPTSGIRIASRYAVCGMGRQHGSPIPHLERYPTPPSSPPRPGGLQPMGRRHGSPIYALSHPAPTPTAHSCAASGSASAWLRPKRR